ncbi:MAG TPA: hypothetical protein VGX25_03430 [Actinophytocola sp.]|uniref:hypothetical protein n=1 Tax=Actinophytocola sp. TaxID=1872138 RepID=UPI002DDDA262|nr:hypothetical protein [Actinophytocola sp.]HEV2778431.1 hypothetical protein [Actinophytocola sp.]
MTTSTPGGLLLDTTALAALASSRSMSAIIASAPNLRQKLYAPVTCLDAADRICPGIAKHIGRLPAIEPLELTYADVLDLRQRAPQVSLDVAHVIALARPTPTTPGGLAVATVLPELYAGYDLRINPIGE